MIIDNEIFYIKTESSISTNQNLSIGDFSIEYHALVTTLIGFIMIFFHTVL